MIPKPQRRQPIAIESSEIRNLLQSTVTLFEYSQMWPFLFLHAPTSPSLWPAHHLPHTGPGPFALLKSHPSTFELWRMVFHDYVGIRKAVTAVSRMRDATVGGEQYFVLCRFNFVVT